MGKHLNVIEILIYYMKKVNQLNIIANEKVFMNNKKIIYLFQLVIPLIFGITFLYWIFINKVDIYGVRWNGSFQFYMILFGVISLITLSFIFKFKWFSIDDYPYLALDSYSFILISFVVAFIGFLGIAFSIINGTLYAAVISNPELAKEIFSQIREQGWVLVRFLVYSVYVLFTNIVIPLVFRYRKEAEEKKK